MFGIGGADDSSSADLSNFWLLLCKRDVPPGAALSKSGIEASISSSRDLSGATCGGATLLE